MTIFGGLAHRTLLKRSGVLEFGRSQGRAG